MQSQVRTRGSKLTDAQYNQQPNEQNQQQSLEQRKRSSQLPANFETALDELRAQFDVVGNDYLADDKPEALTKAFIERFSLYLEQLELRVCLRRTSSSSSTNTFANHIATGTVNPANLCDILTHDFKVLTRDSSSVEVKPETAASKAAAEVYWRASQAVYIRVTCNRLRRSHEDDRLEPLALARRALYFDPFSFQVLRAHMTAIGYLIERGSWCSRDKTFLAMVFRESAQRCAEANPDDYLAHSMLGRYYLTLGTLPWIERALTKSFTCVKFDGGLADAEKHLQRAHQCKPDWPSTGLLVARVLLAMKRPKAEALEWVEFGLKQVAHDATTVIEQGELRELRDKLAAQLAALPSSKSPAKAIAAASSSSNENTVSEG